jgi:hypothetical protein
MIFIDVEEEQDVSTRLTNEDDEDIVTHRSLLSARTTHSIQTTLTSKSMLPSIASLGEPTFEFMDHISYLTHWYEDVTNWKPIGIPEDIHKRLHEESGFRREIRSNFAPEEAEEENLSYGSESSTKSHNHHVNVGYCTITTVVDKPMTQYVLTPQQLFITYQDCIQVHDLQTDKSVACYTSGLPLLHYDRSDILFLGPQGQVFILGDKSAILNNIIMFEGDQRAHEMCSMNDWDHEELTVYTLEMGLRNRELDVVQRSLGSISKNTEILVACIITKFIVETCFAKGSDFRTRIITMALEYVSKLVERRALENGKSDAENVLLLHSTVEQVSISYRVYINTCRLSL